MMQEHPHLAKYVEYIKNAGYVPLPTTFFDMNWEPIGPRVRNELVAAGLIIQVSAGILLKDGILSEANGSDERSTTERLHYFDLQKASPNDHQLDMAKMQGYVPADCLLSGAIVMDEVQKGNSPCWGCEGPRSKCGGGPKR